MTYEEMAVSPGMRRLVDISVEHGPTDKCSKARGYW